MSDELFDQLEAIHAYDVGATDSGIHDELLRARLVAEYDALSDDEQREQLGKWVSENYLSIEARREGYTWDDAHEFIEWITSGDFRR